MKDHKLNMPFYLSTNRYKNNNECRIPFYVSTNNKHLHCLRIFCELFEHFCPQHPLKVLGYDKPEWDMYPHHNFISMGT